MADDLELSYLAGLYDGEGSFSIQIMLKDCNSSSGRQAVWINPRMTVNMKNSRVVLDMLVVRFGGKVYESRKREGMAMWVLSKRPQLVAAATALLPHLKIKRTVAARFLEALSYFPELRAKHVKGERTYSREMVVKVAEIALTLNPPTARRNPRTLEYINELRAMYDAEAVRA